MLCFLHHEVGEECTVLDCLGSMSTDLLRVLCVRVCVCVCVCVCVPHAPSYREIAE